MTWRDRAGFCRTSGRGTTPAVAMKSPLFFFPSSSAVCSRLAAPLLSVDFLVFRSCLSPSHRHLDTMLRTYLASKPGSSPMLGLEGLLCNIAAIGSIPPPPAMVFSLGRASVLSHVMGKGLLSKFSGQASFKCSVRLSRFLNFANTRGLRGGVGGTPLPWHAHISLEVITEIEIGRSGAIINFKLTTVG